LDASGVEPVALSVDLDRSSSAPLAVQLADLLRGAAAEGRLRAGDRLPSTRALAERLAVSRTVTAAAYEQLHAEGWIDGRHGSGTYVTTTPPGAPPSGARPRPAEEQSEALIDLTPGAPWLDGVDRAAWRRAWRAAADSPPLLRPQRAGLTEYRETVTEHLLRHRGLALSGEFAAEGVLATGGTTAAVSELATSALRQGDAVAVEEPGYQRAVQAFQAAGLRVLAAEVDAEGLVVDSVPAQARAVYCSPAHQYPLGGRMSASRRVRLVERARERDWLIVEDDYDGELRFDVAPLPLLAAMAPDVVVHLGTTSKIYSATLGVGWMVAPPRVAAAVLGHRARHGDLGRHLRRLRRELSERRELVTGELAAAGLAAMGDDAGAHVVVPVSTAAEESGLVSAARRSGVLLDGLARHHARRPRWHGVALGYTACTRQQLDTGLSVLIDTLGGARPSRG
jgi:GntR family transcriptional regulator/MocR family aminotransferase